jgi:hypothetical protein
MEEQETNDHPSLSLVRERKEKRQPVRPIINLSQLEEKLNKVMEQIASINVVDLTGIQETLETVVTQQATIIELIKSRLDLDAKEMELMDLFKKKLENL